MANYYVATTGDNGNPGTFAEPWATIVFGVGQLSAGDTLFIRAGTYNEAITAATFAGSGSSGSPITVRAYATELVTLQPSASCTVLNLTTTARSWLHFFGLVFDQQAATCSTEPVVDIDNNQSNITVEFCDIINGASHGVRVVGNNVVTLKDSAAYSNAGDGFNITGDGYTLEDLVSYSNARGFFVDGNSNELHRCLARNNSSHGVQVA